MSPAHIGQGAPRFYLAMAPELPDPSFAKLVVLTDGQGAREALKRRLREAVVNGLAPEARVRVTQLVFGPYSPYPVAWRVMGPDPHALLDIAERVKSVLQASPLMRTVNTDWGSRVPVMHFSFNQDRLQASGLSSQSVAQQLQFLLSGIPITTVREDIRAVQVIGRAAGDIRLDPAKIADFTLVGSGGQRVPLSQIGDVSIRMEDPLLRRRDRTPIITVRGDVAENLQPPDVSTALMKPLQPIIDSLPPGYRIETAGSIEESGKATRAMVPLFPIMIAPHAADHYPAGAFAVGDGHGFPDRAAGADWRGPDAAAVQSAVWHQCPGGPDRPVGDPDAQYADPDWPNPS